MKLKDKRIHRKIRIRKKISGTSKVPRLAVFKSNNNIYVQAIDDLNQVTIASASTLSKEVKTKTLSVESAKEVGEVMGEKLAGLKIKSAVLEAHKHGEIGGYGGTMSHYISVSDSDYDVLRNVVKLLNKKK